MRLLQPARTVWLLLAALFCNAADASAASPSVVVVASAGLEAQRSAIEGIQAALAKSQAQIRIVDLGQARSDRAAGARLAPPGTRLIIAIGSEALQLAMAERPDVPVIGTMILRSMARPEAANTAATISLDISIAGLLAKLKQIFPEKKRLGVIRNPALGGVSLALLQARAQPLGFTVRVVDCPGAEQLLASLRSLKGEVDFVWCLPDGTLYNSATIKPLILASIESRLPLIGFSESFARAGAAVGVYPDYRDIGVQTGEAALQILEGQPPHAAEGPRRLKVAVNQSVLRLLGLRLAPSAVGDKEVSILQ